MLALCLITIFVFCAKNPTSVFQKMGFLLKSYSILSNCQSFKKSRLVCFGRAVNRTMHVVAVGYVLYLSMHSKIQLLANVKTTHWSVFF